jgi:hypothetical protein
LVYSTTGGVRPPDGEGVELEAEEGPEGRTAWGAGGAVTPL